MSIPRVMLLTNWSPNFRHAGTVYFEDLLRFYPKDRLCFFAITPDYDRSFPDQFQGFPIEYGSSPRERSISRFGKNVAHLAGDLLHKYNKSFNIPKLIDQAVKFGRENNCDLVLSALTSPSIIYMAQEVVGRLNADLISLVHDPPEEFAHDFAIGNLTIRTIMKKFEKILRSSIRCATISEGMRKEYRDRFGVDSIILMHAPDPKLRRSPRIKLSEKDRLIIGFSGSLYATKEWDRLLSALAEANWRIADREVTIRLITGSSVRFKAKGKMRIEYLGWQPTVADAVDQLSETDLAYLPYWFDPKYAHSVRTCFPSKLPTYLAAGCPIFYHGPEVSSVTDLFKKYEIGLSCHSTKNSEIIKSLTRLATDENLRSHFATEIDRAIDLEFNMANFHRRFADLIGISVSDLSND